MFDGTAWTVTAAWSPTNTFIWTPATANNNYRVEVWVRSAANTADLQEASNAIAFPIEAPKAAVVPVSSVTIAANLLAPQPSGTAITWTASAVGGTGPYLYKWFVIDGTGYTVAGEWNPSATFVWSPAAASSYRIMVWVKSATNPADQSEARTDKGFTIQPR